MKLLLGVMFKAGLSYRGMIRICKPPDLITLNW